MPDIRSARSERHRPRLARERQRPVGRDGHPQGVGEVGAGAAELDPDVGLRLDELLARPGERPGDCGQLADQLVTVDRRQRQATLLQRLPELPKGLESAALEGGLDYKALTQATLRMSLDPRVSGLLQREFATIRTVRDPALVYALAEIRERAGMQGGAGHGTGLVHVIDKRCATEFLERGADYMECALRRLAELREPWTEGVRSVVEGLVRPALANDWNWLIGVRNDRLGSPLKEQSTGQIDAAQNTVLRRIEAEFAFRVLREERRRLPIADLLSPPRYTAVLQHWELAHEYADGSPSADKEAAREALLALEALGRLVVDDGAATLGDVVKALRDRTDDAGRLLLTSIEKIWAFTNVAPSVRHGGGPGDPVTQPEAQYVVGVTREAIRFLLTFDLG